MNFSDVLFHPTLIFATILYSVMAISFAITYQRFLHKIGPVSGSHWIAKHIGEPFIHVLLLVAFIYMTYPVLFGMESHNAAGDRILPSLSNLLNATNAPTMKLINTLFIISVLLPLIPVVNHFIALILPLQAIAAGAILYGWLANYTGIEYALFPGYKVLAVIVLLSLLADLAAKALAQLFGQSFNEKYRTRDVQKIIHKSALLIFQVPVLLIYTLNLSL